MWVGYKGCVLVAQVAGGTLIGEDGLIEMAVME